MITNLRTLHVRVVLMTVIVACSARCDREPADPHVEPAPPSVAADDGVPIHYEVHGAGPTPLVFVHGWSSDRSYWNGQLPAFAKDFRVVAVDLGGHGESGLGRERWTIQSFGADVVAILDELELENVIVVGHSMGGDVGLQTALQSPERVSGVIMVDTYQQLRTPRTAEQVEEFVGQFRHDFKENVYEFVRHTLFLPDADASLADRVAADMASAPPVVGIQSVESSFTHGRTVTDLLDQLAVPVVAINPEQSSNDVESLERHGVDVVTMPGVGHFLMMEDPDGFNALLRDVIETLVR